MRTLLVLGNFGYVTDQLDGQTVKTRAVYRLLQERLGGNCKIIFFDTQGLQERPRLVATMLWNVLKARDIAYLPGQHNLSRFFTILYGISVLFRKNILYLVIGGWLPDFLRDKPAMTRRMRRIKEIFPENKEVKDRLEKELGFNNVTILPNFRFQESVRPVPQEETPTGEKPFRMVFLSRITETKGVFTVFNVLRKLKEMGCRTETDFYGPVDSEISERFERELAMVSEDGGDDLRVAYKGCLPQKDVVARLSAYDMMILPTFYEGEGFPGAVVDAYMAGIPVAISDWKYNAEYVRNAQTGFVVPLNEKQVEAYAEIAVSLANHPEELDRMKAKARQEALKYTDEAVWKILKDYF